MKDTDYPIYVHTHPTGARAVKLYSDFGFKLITDPVVGYRKNNLAESLPILKNVLPETDYSKLQTVKADVAFLEAVLTNEDAEF